ncbi:metal-sulfur cluster assembly factor [Micromonospora sp. NPDC085948]|uniref:metal-sulfur cluster assembly factor n=1 Tax=Micromonospora sp. NPDC085948 TaxID=3155293 RepID=UPI0034394502
MSSENTATAATPEAGDAVAASQTDALTTDAVTTDGAVAPAAGDAVASTGGDAVAPAAGDAVAPTGGVSKAMIADIEEAMKDVVDPELGINVVDLGLVYGVHVDDENVATLDMTLTSAACPLTDVIEDQTRQALTTGPGGGLVNDIRINWVWLPPWGPDKITDEGRDQLRSLGFNV